MTLISLDYYKKENILLSPGIYPAEIIDCELTRSQAGNEMLVFHWIVQHGEFVDTLLLDYVVLHHFWRVKRYAALAGLASGRELDTEDFMGIQGRIEVGQRDSRNVIKQVLPLNNA